MELKGTHKFAAPPQAVWDALHNSAVLKSCIPGVEDVQWQGENAIVASVSGIGPIKGPFSGQVQVVEHTNPSRLTVALNRTSVSGSVTVNLAPDGDGTLLTYSAVGNLNGALAVLDNPLTRPIIDGQIGNFFTKLESHIN